MKYDRRTLLKDALWFTGAAAAMTTLPIRAGVLPELQETDPEAVAIGYVRDARKIDTKKHPNYVEGQDCANCGLAGFSSAMRKPCQLVPGKLVNAGGWCDRWIARF